MPSICISNSGFGRNFRVRAFNKLSGDEQVIVFTSATAHTRDVVPKQKKIRMKKTLYDLTKDEWNTFFPIELVDHSPAWIVTYEQEKERIIKNVDKKMISRIEHFGSSSIPSIKSKPYIDILIEIPKEMLFDENLISQFTDLGYSHFKVPERDNIETYSSFGKGYNLDGKKEQIFHIHMCPKENWMWKQIGFRDYLNSNTERAKEYENLKLELASKFKNDRGAYVLGKAEFVRETLKLINESMATTTA